jgi:hypothetical protein
MKDFGYPSFVRKAILQTSAHGPMGHGFSTSRSHISESPRFAEEHGSKRLELDPSISLDDLNEL